jgi:hypothetical protein
MSFVPFSKPESPFGSHCRQMGHEAADIYSGRQLASVHDDLEIIRAARGWNWPFPLRARGWTRHRLPAARCKANSFSFRRK